MSELMDLEATTSTKPPRTATVLVFLAASAMILSWLAVYALTDALIAADLMHGWSRETDPRPGWMLRVFFGMFGTFAAVGTAFRWWSQRQLRRIDAMLEVEG